MVIADNQRTLANYAEGGRMTRQKYDSISTTAKQGDE
jgi:uncharacterized protein YjhX (UPF0386 family)